MPPSNSRQKKIRAATLKLRGNARHLAFIRALRENRFNKARRGIISAATRKAPRLTKKERAKIAEKASMEVNKPQPRTSGRTVRKNYTTLTRNNTRTSARPASAAVTQRASSAPIEITHNEYKHRRSLGELPRYYKVEGHPHLSQLKGSTHLATIAEGANEPSL